VIGDAHNDFAAQLAQSGATPTTDTRVALDFRYWGKLQMAISGVSQSFNLLAEQTGATARPSGGAAVPAVAVLAGSTATSLLTASADLAQFAVGDLIAVDVDYAGGTGYIGTGIA